MFLKIRLDAASRLLASSRRITEAAIQCGYNDHSEFKRQFKATGDITPR
jgi:AraC-like DNA-binding protein